MNTYTHPGTVASVEQIIVPEWSPEPSFLPSRFTGRSVPVAPGLYLDESLVEVISPEYVDLEQMDVEQIATV